MVNATLPHLTLHQTPSPNINTSLYDTMQKFLTLISELFVVYMIFKFT